MLVRDPKIVRPLISTLPPLSSSLQEVMNLLNSEQARWSQIGRSILKDPVLAGRVLHIANSSFYGFFRKINDIDVACSILGMETLKSLINTLILLERFREDTENNLIDYQFIWRHGLRSGCLIKNIAISYGLDATTAFAAGLFHCMDLIILDYFFKNELNERISNLKRKSPNISAENTTFELIDIRYWWLTSILLDHWRFPPVMIDIFSGDADKAVETFRKLILISNIYWKKVDIENVKLSQSSKSFFLASLLKEGGLPPINCLACINESDELYTELMQLIL